MKKVLIVGSGLYGLTLAHLIADELDCEVKILESRSHIGGNAFSYLDSNTGIEIHKYGSHLFHTSNERVWSFINGFCRFNSYRHAVWSTTKKGVYSLPINLLTINQTYGSTFNPDEAKEFIYRSIPVKFRNQPPSNFEEKAISLIGPELYDLLIRGYTLKQWSRDPRDLPAETIARLPVRFSYDNRYFNDKYEGLPSDGYYNLFNSMIDLPNIIVETETDWFDVDDTCKKSDFLIYTGPIDRFFSYKFGPLGWRTLDFEFQTLDLLDFQGCAVMNYSDEDVKQTRIHEFKHLYPERETVFKSNKTTIAYEFSRESRIDDEPYYPINSRQDRERLLEYRSLARRQPRTLFGGRLGSYQYLDMHMAIASAISDFENQIKQKLT